MTDVGPFAQVSAGAKHTWYLSQSRTQIYGTGVNLFASMGLDPAEGNSFEDLVLVYDIAFDSEATPGEKIKKIISGHSANLVWTDRRLLYFGRNNEWQLPSAIANGAAFPWLRAFEIDLHRLCQRSFDDLAEVTLQFDRLGLIFKDNTAVTSLGHYPKEEETDLWASKIAMPDAQVFKVALGPDFDIIETSAPPPANPHETLEEANERKRGELWSTLKKSYFS